MGFNNPDVSWRSMQQRLAGHGVPAQLEPDGGDAPAWSRKRSSYVPADIDTDEGPRVPYAELHCHSNFSFLDGASSPEALIEQAVARRLDAIALTDHNGFAGAARFAEAASMHGIDTLYGTELSIGLTTPMAGAIDPDGSHLLLLARGVEGYHGLAKAITEANLRGGEKGLPDFDVDELVDLTRGNVMVLTGCRKGWLRQAMASGGDPRAVVKRLVDLFGADHVTVELTHTGLPGDDHQIDALADLAAEVGLPTVVTGNVHAATEADARLAHAFAAVRARKSLDEAAPWLAPVPILRSGAEQWARLSRHGAAIARSVSLGRELAFDLQLARPKLPQQKVPDGHTSMSWLRELVRRGADIKYAHMREEAEARLARELAVIESKDFAGYFLIVHDIVAYAREQGILCQGRGSAANSAVCYALGITAVDSIKFDLPFERFLAATRHEEPDIDVDFDAGRREEVIQWVYKTYGRRNAAQVANVITYRDRSAIRDMARALGYSPGQADAWSKESGRLSATGDADAIPPLLADLAAQAKRAPRHLGIHSGGMVLTDRPVGEIVPIEPARMAGRTVLQWDKDDCAFMGLVKFDLLGLGMLAALSKTFDLVAEHLDEQLTLETIPKEEPGVYDMLCHADSIGVFQVESRAQIGTLPRLLPRQFYDLVVEVGLIRPGPIQGGAVHPYLERRQDPSKIAYLHSSLEPILGKTLGVPLFQEQLMQIAMTVGGCTGDDADLLRRAMGSKRGIEKIERLEKKLYAGMEAHEIPKDVADAIYAQIQAFADFGFAESHAISFALLVYASAWLKLHYPAAFLVALLRSQPMGFYSSQSLVADARHHGVIVLGVDINASAVQTDLESMAPHDEAAVPVGPDACLAREQPEVGAFNPEASKERSWHRRDGQCAVRMGLDSVRGVGAEDATRIVRQRQARPFVDISDVLHRCGLKASQAEALAMAGAFDSFGIDRRQALWHAGSSDSVDTLEGTGAGEAPPMLPGMSDAEMTLSSLWASGVSPDTHVMEHLRDRLPDCLRAADLPGHETARRVKVAGLITHRQRPATAGGVTFLNLEDETGMTNVVVFSSVWERNRQAAAQGVAVVVQGMLEHEGGATNLVAERIWRVEDVVAGTHGMIPAKYRSRDFR